MSKWATFVRLCGTNRRDVFVAGMNYIFRLRVWRFLDDETYLKIMYWVRFGKVLNLKNPQTFNEKLNWLKLNDRKPIYSKMVDKAAVKELVSETIGEEYVIPTLGVYDTMEEVNLEALPRKFVIKCTHDCGSVTVCTDKLRLDWRIVKKKIECGMRKNLFFWAREWPYKNLVPRIIVERYIESSEEYLTVYKVFCFHGQAKLVQVIQNDKTEKETIDYFDRDWNLLDICQDYPNSSVHISKPKQLTKMLELSEQFLRDRPFIRVDWYIVGDKILFSEFTFFSDAGMAHFNDENWDLLLGGWMHLGLLEENKVG